MNFDPMIKANWQRPGLKHVLGVNKVCPRNYTKYSYLFLRSGYESLGSIWDISPSTCGWYISWTTPTGKNRFLSTVFSLAILTNIFYCFLQCRSMGGLGTSKSIPSLLCRESRLWSLSSQNLANKITSLPCTWGKIHLIPLPSTTSMLNAFYLFHDEIKGARLLGKYENVQQMLIDTFPEQKQSSKTQTSVSISELRVHGINTLHSPSKCCERWRRKWISIEDHWRQREVSARLCQDDGIRSIDLQQLAPPNSLYQGQWGKYISFPFPLS